MLISVHSGIVLTGSPAEVVDDVRRAADAGYATYWAPMLTGMDTLTALAVAGAAVDGIRLGTAVAPIPLRSPYALAQQVKTVQALTGGRLSLGLGTSHRAFVEGAFGQTWSPPLGAMRDYLERLDPLLEPGAGPATGAWAKRPEILVGGVNPAMAALSFTHADGAITWAAGLRTLEQVVFPAAAAVPAGRRARIVASLPVAVTDDPVAARSVIRARLGANDALPTYRTVLAREGVESVADLALVGDEDDVQAQLGTYAHLGVSEFAARIVGDPAVSARTHAFLASIAAGALPASLAI